MLYELPDFEYFEPHTIEEALEILSELGSKAKILAGGTDLLGLMKDRIQGPAMPIPSALVNIKRIEELGKISHSETESWIGAAVGLSEIEHDDELIKRFPVLTHAAKSVATNQIRNMGTLGGNLCQRPWCWYFRHPAFNCFKKGGNQCYAITGNNSTYFSIFNIGTCVMAHPSDTAPALISLDAKVQIASPREGRKEIEISNFFLGPKNVQDNILGTDEILLGVRIPKTLNNEMGIYLKHRIRNNWDFALASVAALGGLDKQGKISKIRIALGGVAPLPFRIEEAEAILIGKPYSVDLKNQAIQQVVKRAKPLRMNRYKVRIIRALVSRALDSVLLLQ